MRWTSAVVTAFLTTIPSIAASQDMVFNGKPSEFEDYSYLVREAAWVFSPGQAKVIFVCWENLKPSNSVARQFVQAQITDTWQRHTALEFRGWDQCATSNSGIRIVWKDEGPHVKAFGRHLDNVKNGMVLNHTFKNWSPSCQDMMESCIRSIAVHEFGHAIGFAHEQNRPDTPGECSEKRGQNQPDEVPLTPYDPSSVMNYCNSRYNNDGQLSRLDIRGAQKVYGAP